MPQTLLAHRPQGPGYDGKKLVGSLDAEKRFFDFEKLAEVTRVVTRNLNKIIDVNFYPTESARRSNMRHRPIGLGVQVRRCSFCVSVWRCMEGVHLCSRGCGGWQRRRQRWCGAVWLAVLCLWAGGCLPAMAHWRQLAADGLTVCCCGCLCLACPLAQGLADTFLLLGMPFDSSEAAQLNKEIFETIYYASLETSCHLAKEQGPYETYEGSPVSKGVLQHDMWGVKVSLQGRLLLVCAGSPLRMTPLILNSVITAAACRVVGSC